MPSHSLSPLCSHFICVFSFLFLVAPATECFWLRTKPARTHTRMCFYMPKARPNVCKNKTSNGGDDRRDFFFFFAKTIFANLQVSEWVRETERTRPHAHLTFGVRAKARQSLYALLEAIDRFNSQKLTDAIWKWIVYSVAVHEQPTNIERCQRQPSIIWTVILVLLAFVQIRFWSGNLSTKWFRHTVFHFSRNCASYHKSEPQKWWDEGELDGFDRTWLHSVAAHNRTTFSRCLIEFIKWINK